MTNQHTAHVAGAQFLCPRCGRTHGYGEPAFEWPDAVFALSLPDPEKRAITDTGHNEDTAIVRDGHFVRGILPIPVEGWQEPLAIGIWIRISAENYRDFEHRGRVDHPDYPGELANQATFLEPTLGLRATMSFRAPGWRPTIRLVDPSGLLAKGQESGVPDAIARQWLGDTVHDGEAEPMGPMKMPDLDKDGYRLVTADEAGRDAVLERPSVGDQVKILVQFLASDDKGDPTPLVAGWWLELDEVGASGPWSGTLQNAPRVPAPIVRGARFWITAAHVIELAR